MQRGSQVVICCRCIGSLRNILIFVNIFGKKHKSYLVKAVLELGHVALEHSGAHEVGEEDGLEVSHLIPGNHSYLIHKFLYLEDNFMLLTIAAMISIFAPLATDNLFVVGST